MKTFKMISIALLKNNEKMNIPLEDGIIINQENSYRSWIIEMYIDKQHSNLFTEAIASEEMLEVSVVISYPENEPATFQVIVYTTKEIGDYISVLMKGTLKRARRKYAESLLSELVEDGLSGEALVTRFESDMRERPKLKKDEVEQ
ncbi:YwpF family protein [Paenisporosarcina cavernae]|uniref:YwpF protein n=1 Tax=Paenisporosarcina cavernae TaxID=2320858 RepID=A0A385YQU4_9BACL|nr:YwpF family protein [Paenisporosarcina cavernae]AYC28851.1 hypothetical protein D3873_02800 [Paenisporosarcina cavernae]